MSNDTPSWSGDDHGSEPPPPPPPPPPAGPSSGTGSGDPSWSAPSEAWSPGPAANYGSLPKRFLARVLDGIIIGIPLGLLLIFGLGLAADGIAYAILTAVANLAYFMFLESSQGATLGKRILGMSVVGTGGGTLSPERSFRRNWWLLLGIVPVIGPLASLGVTIYIAVTIAGDERNQGFHDKLADALVLDR